MGEWWSLRSLQDGFSRDYVIGGRCRGRVGRYRGLTGIEGMAHFVVVVQFEFFHVIVRNKVVVLVLFVMALPVHTVHIVVIVVVVMKEIGFHFDGNGPVSSHGGEGRFGSTATTRRGTASRRRRSRSSSSSSASTDHVVAIRQQEAFRRYQDGSLGPRRGVAPAGKGARVVVWVAAAPQAQVDAAFQGVFQRIVQTPTPTLDGSWSSTGGSCAIQLLFAMKQL